MNDRDRELDELLKPLRNVRPTPEQLAKWQALAPQRTRSAVVWRIAELAAACIVGFVIAAAYFRQPSEHIIEVATNFDPDATIERVYVNNQ